MTKEEKLISLLQDKNYKSKIKLYCFYSFFAVKKYKEIEQKEHTKIIEVKEL